MHDDRIITADFAPLVNVPGDTFVVSRSGSQIVVTRGGVQMLAEDRAAIPGLSLTITGGDDDDSCTIDYANGDPIEGIAFNFVGGAGTNTLTLLGTCTQQTIALNTATAGTVDLDGSTTAFQDLALLTGAISDSTQVLTPTGTAATDANVSGVSGNIHSQGTTLTNATFPAPTTSLTCTLGNAGDILSVAAFEPNYAVSVAGLGTLRIAAGGLSWASGSIAVDQGIVADFASGHTTLGALISGSGGLSKSGAGTLQLTSAKSYTGGTIVNGGRLHVSNSSGSATGTGPVTVDSGAFGGPGRVTSSITVNAGGSLAP